MFWVRDKIPSICCYHVGEGKDLEGAVSRCGTMCEVEVGLGLAASAWAGGACAAVETGSLG
jgi:hypothetical protein